MCWFCSFPWFLMIHERTCYPYTVKYNIRFWTTDTRKWCLNNCVDFARFPDSLWYMNGRVSLFKTKINQLFLNTIIICFGIKTLITHFNPVTFKIIKDWLFRIMVLVPQLCIEILWFSQNSEAGFHVTAVPLWLKLKYYLRFICFVILNFQNETSQWSVVNCHLLTWLRTPQFKAQLRHTL